MAQIFDGVVPSLLQGVSQQIPRERLQGQLSVQKNMLSDLFGSDNGELVLTELSTCSWD